jgi:hypothetical protein
MLCTYLVGLEADIDEVGQAVPQLPQARQADVVPDRIDAVCHFNDKPFTVIRVGRPPKERACSHCWAAVTVVDSLPSRQLLQDELLMCRARQSDVVNTPE